MTTDWIQTRSGRRFSLSEPRPEDVDLEDVAWHLSLLCRFTGAAGRFYSVAEHSLHVAAVAERQCPGAGAWGLLHDAAEAYVGDLSAPLRGLPELAGYRTVYQRVERVILERFALAPTALQEEAVQHVDLLLLAAEREVFMTGGALPAPPWPGLPASDPEIEAVLRVGGLWRCRRRPSAVRDLFLSAARGYGIRNPGDRA